MKRLIKKSKLPTVKDFYPNSLDFDYINVGSRTVYVDDIVGLSEGRVDDYNDDWTPIQSDDPRWEYAYNNFKDNKRVQPIPLLKTPDGKYFANGDGNHRIAAAKVLGISQIEAEVTVMVPRDADLEEEWEKYSKGKQDKLNQLHEQYDNMNKEIYKAQDERNNELERELINKQNSIGKQMNQLSEELEQEEKEFKKDLLNQYLDR